MEPLRTDSDGADLDLNLVWYACHRPDTLLLSAEEAMLLTAIMASRFFPASCLLSCTMPSSLSVKLLMRPIAPYVEHGMALE